MKNESRILCLCLLTATGMVACRNEVAVVKYHSPVSYECVVDADCTQDKVCLHYVCVEKELACMSNEQCKQDEVCAGHECVKRSLVCQLDEDCDPDEVCVNYQCTPGDSVCQTDADCGQNQACIDHVCMDNVRRCSTDVECPINQICENHFCVDGNPECVTDADCPDAQICMDRLCVDFVPTCTSDLDCSKGSFCDALGVCCSDSAACGNTCCSKGHVCVDEKCVLECGDDQFYCMGSGSVAERAETCCANGELCVDGGCFLPSFSCYDNYACKDDEYCELESHTCLPKPDFDVTCPIQEWAGSGEFKPQLLFHWGGSNLIPEDNPEHINVIMAPMVADVNGDNVPEIVFNSWTKDSMNYMDLGILRIISGKDGSLLASSNSSPYTDPSSQVAIGRIYPKDVTIKNGVDVSGLQIITCTEDHHLIAYNHRAEVIWKNDSASDECDSTAMGLVDFDGDGLPEVYARYHVYSAQTGAHLAGVDVEDKGGYDFSIAADLDGDGLPELIGGNVAYKVDLVNGVLTPVYQRNDQPDGFPAIADLDLNGDPEIVSVRKQTYRETDLDPYSHTVMAFKNNGENFWTEPVDIYFGEFDDWGGGPATIARIDDDPHPSIMMSTGTHYLALNYLGEKKWANKIQDRSSRSTGSSVFDFNGDGQAEILYSDEKFFRVYEGKEGKTVFCLCNTSETLYEYPVVADVNNDGQAEIVLVSNRYREDKHCPGSAEYITGEVDDCIQSLLDAPYTERLGTDGVRVYSGLQSATQGTHKGQWMPTRNIYNQHAYSITNVLDDGTIPDRARANWKIPELNNFRLNALHKPTDYQRYMSIYESSVSTSHHCRATQPVYFSVYNSGQVALDPGMKIRVEVRYNSIDAEPFETYEVQTSRSIPVLDHEDLTLDIEIPQNIVHLDLRFVATESDACRQASGEITYVSYDLNCIWDE